MNTLQVTKRHYLSNRMEALVGAVRKDLRVEPSVLFDSRQASKRHTYSIPGLRIGLTPPAGWAMMQSSGFWPDSHFPATAFIES